MGDLESLEINGFGHPPALKNAISMPLIYCDNPTGSMSVDHDARVDKAKLHQQGIITVNSLSFLPGASTRLPTATIPAAIRSLSIPATAPSPSSSSPPTQANTPAQQPSYGGVTSVPALRTLNPAARPETLRAALFDMARQGDCDAGRQLLESGLVMPGAVDPGTGECALLVATEHGQASFVRMLLRCGAPADQRRADGTTSLMLACAAGDEAMVQTLLQAGSRADHASDTGLNSLILAAWCGATAIVSMLLEAGAPIDHATSFGWTALMRAAQGGHVDTMATLLAEGCDMECVACNNRTALMIAAEAGQFSAARALSDAGADTTRRNDEGLSAAEIAAAAGHRKLANMLSRRASSQPVYLAGDNESDGATTRQAIRETTRTAKTTWTTATSTTASTVGSIPAAATVNKTTTTATTLNTTALTTTTSTAAATTATTVTATPAKPLTNKQPMKRPSLSALLQAIADNDRKTLRSLLYRLTQTSQDVDVRLDRAGPLPGFDGPDAANTFTPLMAAAYLGHAEMITMLIGNGATVDKAGYGGRTALWFAEEMKHTEARAALKRSGASVKIKFDDRWSAEAIAEYRKKLADRLADVKTERKFLRNFASHLGRSRSLANESSSSCAMHLSSLMDITSVPNYEGLENYLAALIGSQKNMKKILTAWFPLVLRETDDTHHFLLHTTLLESALFYSRHMNLNYFIDLLVSAGATLNAYNSKSFYKFESYSALVSAVHLSDWKDVIDFIGLGANAEKSCDHIGTTALMIAVQREQIAAVQLISELGANLNHRNQRGDAALHLAARNGSRQVIELLIEKGAHLNQPGHKGLTPLKRAAACGNEPAVEALINAGAKIDTQDSKSRVTALMLASHNGYLPIVALLLAHGANTQLQDREKDTAYDHAKEQGHVEIARLLADHAANTRKH